MTQNKTVNETKLLPHEFRYEYIERNIEYKNESLRQETIEINANDTATTSTSKQEIWFCVCFTCHRDT